MSLIGNKKQGAKSGKNTQMNNAHGSKFISKPGKAIGISKKPIKTGGTRGS